MALILPGTRTSGAVPPATEAYESQQPAADKQRRYRFGNGSRRYCPGNTDAPDGLVKRAVRLSAIVGRLRRKRPEPTLLEFDVMVKVPRLPTPVPIVDVVRTGPL